MRDEICASQLVCLSNLENLNALFISEKLPQPERLKRLNQIAIHQMTILTTHPRPRQDNSHDTPALLLNA
jgi:hypothetical protein